MPWNWIRKLWQREKTGADSDFEYLCPYCGQALTKAPSRRMKCPSCRNLIVVRTIDHRPTLMTGYETASIDAARRHNAYVNKLREIISRLDSCPTDDTISAVKLFEEALDEMEPRDAAWKVLNDLALLHTHRENYNDAASCYSGMAWFRKLHNEDPYPEANEATRLEINHARSEGYKKVRAYSGCTCSKCKAVSGSIQTIRQALKNPLVPVKDCETGVGILVCNYRGYFEG
jgi:hypothetical protein